MVKKDLTFWNTLLRNEEKTVKIQYIKLIVYLISKKMRKTVIVDNRVGLVR